LKRGLHEASDKRWRYQPAMRKQAYQRMEEWLGFRPALCKEQKTMWQALGWKFDGCNCTK